MTSTSPIRFCELSNEPVEYRIPGLLRNRGNVLISAYRKTGKTSLILTLQACLDKGTPFLGKSCEPLPGPSVYTNFELDQPMLRKYAKDLGLDIRSERALVLDFRGRATKFRLSDDEWREDFADMLLDMEASALIVDPIHPVLIGNFTDSNSNDEARATLELLGEVAEMAKLLHLFIVDHTGHADKTRARGASGKEDWADVLWNVQGNGDSRTLDAIGRGVSDSLTYEMTSDGKLTTAPDFGTAHQPGKPTLHGAIRAALADGDALTVAELCAATNASQQRVQEALQAMETMGNIERTGKAGRAELWRIPPRKY